MIAPRMSVADQYQELIGRGQAGWARCSDCRRAHFYPREYCPYCLSSSVMVEPAETVFRIRSFTYVYRPQRPVVGDLPVLLIAGESEGVTIIAEGAEWDGRECAIGAGARLVVSADRREVPVFVPDDGGGYG